MFNLKTYLLNKISRIIGTASNYTDKNKIAKIIKSKIDSKTVQELLIMQYSEKILDSLEKDLKTAYGQHKAYENTLVAHSKEHHRVIDTIQKINQDLEKLQVERTLLKNNTETTLSKVKEDFGITTYNIKKISKS